MTAPKTLEELREAVRLKSDGVAVPEDTKEQLLDAIRRDMDVQYAADMDVQYAAFTETAANYFYVEPPEGWGPTFKLTRRQRFSIWVAAPLVWILKWLDPNALRQDD